MDAESAVRRLGGRAKRPLLYVMSVLYVIAGVTHFVAPDLYVQIVPPYLPFPLALVYISGVAEAAFGAGLVFERTRRLAAWGIIGVLVAVFPANVYMATSDVVIQGAPGGIGDPSAAARWGRLPIQVVLVLWAWWYTRPMSEESQHPE
jgi:uncharacterized membrane protein